MIDNTTLNALATKLDNLELMPEERQALDLVLTRAAAAEAEVQGFAFKIKSAGLSGTGLRLGAAIGGLGIPAPELKTSLSERRSAPSELR
jgi:hypothetical protein